MQVEVFHIADRVETPMLCFSMYLTLLVRDCSRNESGSSSNHLSVSHRKRRGRRKSDPSKGWET